MGVDFSALIRARAQTLAVAESLTGGLLSNRFARMDDAGDWFRGGIVAYCRPVKEELLSHRCRAGGQREGGASLTPTERLVVKQVEAGLTNPQIAAELLMSRDTVKTHVAHVFTKLGIKSRSELAAAAARRPE